MVYKLLKIWAKLAFSLYFRRIFISGTENIPRKGAVLFLVNHPNSFLEACVIAAFQHRNLHFLVRGDMFEKKWLLPILKSTNQIPIFRFKDGFGKLRSNKSTFDQTYKVLADQHALLMFPEASSEMVKYLRPLQKGAARMVLGAIEEYEVEEIYIIPTGIHYYNAPRSRSDVILKFDKAFLARQWLAESSTAEDKVTALTAAFQQAMDNVVVSISHHYQEATYNKSYLLAENEYLPYASAGLWKTDVAYQFIRTLFGGINQLNENRIAELKKNLKSYQGSHFDLRSFDFSVTANIILQLKYFIAALLSLIIGLPGFIVYAPAIALSRHFAKTRIKHLTFYAPVRIAVNMVLHFITTIALLLFFKSNYTCVEIFILIIYLQLSLFSFAIFIDHLSYLRYLFAGIFSRNQKTARKTRSEIFENYFSFFKKA